MTFERALFLRRRELHFNTITSLLVFHILILTFFVCGSETTNSAGIMAFSGFVQYQPSFLLRSKLSRQQVVFCSAGRRSSRIPLYSSLNFQLNHHSVRVSQQDHFRLSSYYDNPKISHYHTTTSFYGRRYASRYSLINKPLELSQLKSSSSTTRLFGTKRTPISNPPGAIEIYDEQTTITNISIPKLSQTISIIRELLAYPTYDINLILNEDEAMRCANLDSRGVDSPTDVLSFPFQDVVLAPGELDEPEFDIEEYYCLGDILIDVPYVVRRCEEDRLFYEEEEQIYSKNNGDAVKSSSSNSGDDERGVSGAMAKIYDPKERIHMLLVHGMLHLVGYDHIKDDDYFVMVEREEEILRLLKKRTRDLESEMITS